MFELHDYVNFIALGVMNKLLSCVFFIGMGRDLVVMVEDVAKENAKIREETLSTREVADLNRGRAFVKSLIESGGSLLTSSVSEGAKAAAKVNHSLSLADNLMRMPLQGCAQVVFFPWLNV